MILGIDFLQKHSVLLDFSTNSLILQNCTMQLGNPGKCTCLIKTMSPTTVSAKSETLIPVKCSKGYCNSTLLITPSVQSEENQIVVSLAVVYVNSRQTMCRVLNKTNVDIELPSDFTLATASTLLESNIASLNDVTPIPCCKVYRAGATKINMMMINLSIHFNILNCLLLVM